MVKPNLEQQTLFSLGDTSSGILELFPEMWGAMEAVTSPDSGVRRAGLETLLESGAPRLSPLVTYLLATRLTDPDIELRGRIIQILGESLTNDPQGNPAPVMVRRSLVGTLARTRTREIYAILEASVQNPLVEPNAARLLNANPYAGNHMADILAARKAPLTIRREAVRLISLVGYVDTIPALERIAFRLESHVNGQQSMPFLPLSGLDDTDLLPEIRAALALLRST